jgi:transcriptional regulator with GAF, ATPase, and Fis domain
VLGSGAAQFMESKAEYANGEVPVAYLPLKLGDDLFGVIIIYKLLIQKEGFRALDFELVELLGKHAASAIYSAKLHATTERKRNTLQGFVDLIKWEHEHPKESK